MDIKRWTTGIVLAAAVSLFGLIQADASPFSSSILSDDLGNRVNGAAPEAGDWDEDPVADPPSDGGADDGGSNTGNGNGSSDNNGHGNNVDGVDSSNKGKSKEGLDTDATVDDEIRDSGDTKVTGKKK